jgi:hypothetical protein
MVILATHGPSEQRYGAKIGQKVVESAIPSCAAPTGQRLEEGRQEPSEQRTSPVAQGNMIGQESTEATQSPEAHCAGAVDGHSFTETSVGHFKLDAAQYPSEHLYGKSIGQYL